MRKSKLVAATLAASMLLSTGIVKADDGYNLIDGQTVNLSGNTVITNTVETESSGRQTAILAAGETAINTGDYTLTTISSGSSLRNYIFNTTTDGTNFSFSGNLISTVVSTGSQDTRGLRQNAPSTTLWDGNIKVSVTSENNYAMGVDIWEGSTATFQGDLTDISSKVTGTGQYAYAIQNHTSEGSKVYLNADQTNLTAEGGQWAIASAVHQGSVYLNGNANITAKNGTISTRALAVEGDGGNVYDSIISLSGGTINVTAESDVASAVGIFSSGLPSRVESHADNLNINAKSTVDSAVGIQVQYSGDVLITEGTNTVINAESDTTAYGVLVQPHGGSSGHFTSHGDLTANAEGASANGIYVYDNGSFSADQLFANASATGQAIGAFIIDSTDVVIGSNGKVSSLNGISSEGDGVGLVTYSTGADVSATLKGTMTIEGSTLGIENDGGTITNDADLTVIGGMYNDSTGVFTNNSKLTMLGNNAGTNDAGAIYNEGTIASGADSQYIFEGNSAANGGAIYNTGSIAFNGNTTFKNNSATSQGGAIYNEGTITFNDNVSFIDNIAGNVLNDIYNAGTIKLNPAAGKTISFDAIVDGNEGTVATNFVNVIGAGTVNLSSKLNNQTVNVLAGELVLPDSSNLAGATNVQVAAGGIVNTIDGLINDYNTKISLAKDAQLKLDLGLGDTPAHDTFAAADQFTVAGFGVVEDAALGATKDITIDANGNKVNVASGIKAYTSVQEYLASASATDGNITITGQGAGTGGLNIAVDDTDPGVAEKVSYNLTADETFTNVGNKTIENANFDINGHDNKITAADDATGIKIDNKSNVTISDAEFSKFDNDSTGAVQNAGTLTLNNVKFDSDNDVSLNNLANASAKATDSEFNAGVKNEGDFALSFTSAYTPDATPKTITTGITGSGNTSVFVDDGATLTWNNTGITQNALEFNGNGHLELSGSTITADIVNNMTGDTLVIDTAVVGSIDSSSDLDNHIQLATASDDSTTASVTGLITNTGTLDILTTKAASSTDPTTFVIQSGIADGISPTGTTNIGDATHNAIVSLASGMTITQKALNIAANSDSTLGGSKLIANASDLIITNGIDNDYRLELTGGSLATDVSGDGRTVINTAGTVNFANATTQIAQTIFVDAGTLALNGSNIDHSTATNHISMDSGTNLNLLGGTLTSHIVANSGNGGNLNVVNNATLATNDSITPLGSSINNLTIGSGVIFTNSNGLTVSNDLTNGGTITNNGDLTFTKNGAIANAGTVGGSGNVTIGNGTAATVLTNSGSITGNIDIKTGAELITAIDKITDSNGLNNDGTLTLNNGTAALTTAVSGNGHTDVKGSNVTFGAAVSQAINVLTGAKLTSVAGNVGGDVAIQGGATFELQGGTLAHDITGYNDGVSTTFGTLSATTANSTYSGSATVGTLKTASGITLTNNNGITVNTALDNLGTINGTGALNLLGSTMANAGTINSTGNVVVGNGAAATVLTNSGSIAGNIDIKANSELITATDKITDSNGLNNDGTLTLNNGTAALTTAVSGNGHTDVKGSNVEFGAKVSQAINVLAGAKLTTDASNIGGDVDNANQLVITGGTLGNDVTNTSGTGVTTLKGNTTIDTGVTVTQTTVNVQATGATNKGTIVANVDNAPTSVFDNTATITGNLDNSGTVTNTGTISGAIDNKIVTASLSTATTGLLSTADIKNSGTLTFNDTADANLANNIVKSTTASGTVDVALATGKTLNLNGKTITDNTITLSSGTFDVKSAADSSGNINLASGNVGTGFIAKGGTLSVVDGKTGTITLGNVNTTASALNVAIDAKLSQTTAADVLTGNPTSITGSNGINISNINIIADPDVTEFTLHVADTSISSKVSTSTMTINRGLPGAGSLLLTYNGSTGNFTGTHSDLSNAIQSSVGQKAYDMVASSTETIGAVPLGGTSLSITGNNATIASTATDKSLKGITIANSGQTLSINGAVIGSSTNGFATAIDNTVGGDLNLTDVTFVNNTTDVVNGAGGDLTIDGTVTLSSKINNAGNIVMNDGDTVLTGGTINNNAGGKITNTATYTDSSDVIHTSTIASAIVNNSGATVDTLADGFTNGISNDGTVNLIGSAGPTDPIRKLASAITAVTPGSPNGTLNISGGVKTNGKNITDQKNINIGQNGTDTTALGHFENNATVTGDNLKINANGELVNDGTVTILNNINNSGSIDNTSTIESTTGSIVVNSGADITNTGNLIAANQITIAGETVPGSSGDAGVVISTAKGLQATNGVVNNGILNLNGNATTGVLSSNISGSGDLNIAGTVNSNKTISQGVVKVGQNNTGVTPGTLTNTGSISATIVDVTASGVLNNTTGTITTTGNVNVASGGSIDNDKTINVGGKVANSGSIDNSDSITATGNIENAAGATITNTGDLTAAKITNAAAVGSTPAGIITSVADGLITTSGVENDGTLNLNAGASGTQGALASVITTSTGSTAVGTTNMTGNISTNKNITQRIVNVGTVDTSVDPSVETAGSLVNNATVNAVNINTTTNSSITSAANTLIASNSIANAGTLNLTGGADSSSVQTIQSRITGNGATNINGFVDTLAAKGITQKELNINAGATFTNNGSTITVKETTVKNTATLNNNGSFASGSSPNNKIIVDNGGTVNNSNSTDGYSSSIKINADIENSGEVNNYSSITALSAVTNKKDGVLNNKSTGKIYASVTNNAGAVINNEGAINGAIVNYNTDGTNAAGIVNTIASGIKGGIDNQGVLNLTAATTAEGKLGSAITDSQAVKTGITNIAGTVATNGKDITQKEVTIGKDKTGSTTVTAKLSNADTVTADNININANGTLANTGNVIANTAIDNDGAITNAADSTISAAAGAPTVINNSGSITNAAKGSGTAAGAIIAAITNDGNNASITNNGSITGSITNAAGVDNVTIANSGTITGNVDNGNQTGNVINNLATGTIQSGTVTNNGGTVNNTAGGLISSAIDNKAGSVNTLASKATGGITNDGTVNLSGTTAAGTDKLASTIVNGTGSKGITNVAGVVDTNGKNITQKTVNVGQSGTTTAAGILNNSDSILANDVNVTTGGVLNNTGNIGAVGTPANITNNGDTNLTSGTVVANAIDNKAGTTDITGGSVTAATITNTAGATTISGGNVNATTGITNTSGTTDITGGSVVANAITNTAGTTTISGGTVNTTNAITNNGTAATDVVAITGGTVTAADIINNGGTTNINNPAGSVAASSTITNNSGTTNISSKVDTPTVNANGGDINVAANGDAKLSDKLADGAGASQVNIADAGKIAVNTNSDNYSIDNNVTGTGALGTGNLELDGSAGTARTASVVGETVFTIDSAINNATVSLVTGQLDLPNENNLTNTTLNIGTAATLNTIDGSNSPFNSDINFANNSEVKFDVNALSKTSDKFNNITEAGNEVLTDVQIADLDKIVWNNTDINLKNTSGLSGLIVSDELQGRKFQAMTPIRIMEATIDANGMMNIHPSSGRNDWRDFNPSILASPIAAQLGGYLTQLNSYDEAFRNMDMYMLMTKKQRQAIKLRNQYAAAGQTDFVTYDPNQSMYEKAAGWFRPYAQFERVNLKNGPTVSNVAYGSFFGGDSELKDLGNGWDGMWGAYVGYNGSHQAYNGIGIYQNGGTLGAVGMAYKGDFFTGLTVNVGANAGEASLTYGTDHFSMLMAGIASKTGYNWELADGKFIIQPSYLMSYSFVNTFDYTNAAGVRMNSNPLNAIQIEPGLKFIGNLKNGWQPYVGISVVWNIMDKSNVHANDIALPELSIKPFVKYGLGVRKTWGERFSGFFQTYFTGGGRNGVGLQAGFRWAIGGNDKQSSTPAKSSAKKQVKETKVSNPYTQSKAAKILTKMDGDDTVVQIQLSNKKVVKSLSTQKEVVVHK